MNPRLRRLGHPDDRLGRWDLMAEEIAARYRVRRPLLAVPDASVSKSPLRADHFTLAARGPDLYPLTAGGEAQSSIIQVYALTRDTRAEILWETLMSMIASARGALGLPEAILRKKAPRLL